MYLSYPEADKQGSVHGFQPYLRAEVCRCCGSFTGVDTEYNLVGYETDTLGNKGVFFYTDG